jgi:hypothetical protein
MFLKDTRNVFEVLGRMGYTGRAVSRRLIGVLGYWDVYIPVVASKYIHGNLEYREGYWGIGGGVGRPGQAGMQKRKLPEL